MERCNSLKRHRKETKPLSPIHILLSIVTHQRPSLYLLWQQFWRFFFPSLCSSLHYFLLCFPLLSLFFIFPRSPLFSPLGQLQHFLRMTAVDRQWHWMKWPLHLIVFPPGEGRRGWRLREHSNEDLWQMGRWQNKTPKGMALKSHSQCNIHCSCNRVCW